MTQALPEAIQNTLLFLYVGLLVAAPVCSILYGWTERSRLQGVSLMKYVGLTFGWALAFIVVIGATAVIAWFKLGDQLPDLASMPWLLAELIRLALFGIAYSAAWFFGAQWAYHTAAKPRVSDEHLKGAVVVDGSEKQKESADFRAEVERKGKPNEYVAEVRLGGVGMPLTPNSSEVLQTLVVGTTGSGKSVAIRSMMRDIAERAKYTHERMLICDPDGGYLSRFYEPQRGDLVWNPYDARSVVWGLPMEMHQDWDPDNIATAIVPPADGEAKTWADMARMMVSSALEELKRTPGAQSRDLYDLLNRATGKEQFELLANTPATIFYEEGAEKTRASMRITLATATKALRYLPRGDNFSVRDWIRNGKGWLFLPYSSEQIAALQPLFRTLVRIAVFAALSLPEQDNGLWFCIDELDALGKLEGLHDAMVRLRKKGGRMILGLQTIAMVETLYGRGPARAIVENAGNRLILRCGSGDEGEGTREWAARLIGKHKVRRIVTSTNISSGSGSSHSGESSQRGVSVTISEQSPAPEALVMPEEIDQLPDCTGFLKFANRPEWQRITFPVDDLPAVAPAVIPKTPEESS